MKKKKAAGKTGRPAIVLDHYLEMQEAIRYAESCNWQAAENICRRIVADNPQHIDAINMLGVVAIKLGQWAQAVQMMQRLITLKSDYLNAYINLGMVLREMGDMEGAARYSRQALKIKPDSAEAFSNLGNALLGQGKPQEAVEAYEAALRINPRFRDALNNLNVARRAGGLSMQPAPAPAVQPVQPAALPSADLATTLQRLRDRLAPANMQTDTPPQAGMAADARPLEQELALADRFIAGEEYERAVPVLRNLLALDQNNAAAHCNLATALIHLDKHADALPHCHRAVALSAEMPEAHNNLGLALCSTGQPEHALASYQRALELRPDFIPAMENMAIALRECGRFAEALPWLERVLELQPAHAGAHYERGLLLLRLGRYADGFREYEWRRQVTKHRLAPLPQPEWDGRPFPGQRLLVHLEQGLGDAIQFARYLAQAKALGGSVVLRCHPSLLELFDGLSGVDERVDSESPLPQADWHVSLLSLSRLFTFDAASIPAPARYLQPSPAKAGRWLHRLRELPGPKIGLVWAGNPDYRNDRTRSMTLETLAPLAMVSGVSFISLQKGPAAAQALHPPAGMRLYDWTDELADFAETAALASCLDLIISVDTAVAHLAGALGRPVWTLLPFPADWRWLADRSDSPWYPSMRLFRQTPPGGWDPVVEEVQSHLRSWAPAPAPADDVPSRMGDDRRDWLQIVADFVPDGAAVAQIGSTENDLAARLPPGCSVVNLNWQTLDGDVQRLRQATYVVAADVPVDGLAALQQLRHAERRVILTVPAGRTPHLGNAVKESGFSVLAEQAAIDRRIWLLSPYAAQDVPTRRIALITTGHPSSFGETLRRRQLFSVLPPGAELTIAAIEEMQDLEPDFDLAIVGTGGDLGSNQISDALLDFLGHVPRAVGLFGLAADEGDPERVGTLLDQLFLWGARFEQDVLLHGRGRGNALHFGDWLVDAIPASALPTGAHLDLPAEDGSTPDRMLELLRHHAEVSVSHPDLLLAALCTCRQVAYQPASGEQARYRALLIDVLGRHFPPSSDFPVDRRSVFAYKARIRLMIDELRKAIAIALGIAPP